MSRPIDITLKGNNQVLILSNGNTMLFHFEKSNNVAVWVFDSLGKQLAYRKESYHVLDDFEFERPEFKGILEIDGEAVLFIDQEIRTRHCLIRLRYNGATGRLVEEKMVAESQNANRRMEFHVMKHMDDSGYAIFFCTDISHPRSLDAYVVFFDTRHHELREVQLPINRKKFDFLKVLGAEATPCGNIVAIGVDKTLEYGRVDHDAPIVEGGSVYDHKVVYFFIPHDSSKVQGTTIDFGEAVFPASSLMTCSPSDRTFNSVMLSAHPLAYRFGLENAEAMLTSTLFVNIDHDDLKFSARRITDSLANQGARKDTTYNITDRPERIFTGAQGTTTILSAISEYRQDDKTLSRYQLSWREWRVTVTEVNKDGNEIWGTSLPCNRAYGRQPLYSDEFEGPRLFSRGSCSYILFNDYDPAAGLPEARSGDLITGFANTSAFYYKVDAAHEVTRQYLFGAPQKKEFKPMLSHSCYFDEHNGKFAALVQYKKGDNISYRMAWSRLE